MDLYGGAVVLTVPYSHWKHWLHFRMMSEIRKAGENSVLPCTCMDFGTSLNFVPATTHLACRRIHQIHREKKGYRME